MDFNSDGTVSIPALRLTANQLDELLRDLALYRSQMIPHVPLELPSGEQSLNFAEVTAMGLSTRAPIGVATVMLRHPGFGWLSFAMHAVHAENLALFFNHVVQKSIRAQDPSDTQWGEALGP